MMIKPSNLIICPFYPCGAICGREVLNKIDFDLFSHLYNIGITAQQELDP